MFVVMNVLGIVVLALYPFVKSSLLTSQTNDSVTTDLIIKRDGYPVEIHTVQTEDGYILKMHRIPYSSRMKTSTSDTPRPVIFLMHGLSASSSDWCIIGPNQSLSYILSDLGYDVWLGNARGNTYSKKHITYKPSSLEFWNFTWHEISIYDLPAMLNYIMNLTGVKKLRYVGHSQGTTNYLVLNSKMPEWNDRFISAHLLAPVGFVDNARNIYLKLSAPFVVPASMLGVRIGNFEFKPSKQSIELLATVACNRSLPAPVQVLCDNSLFLSTEFNEDTANLESIPDLMDTTPASISANQFVHFLQEYYSKHFREYDYGLVRNLVVYGSTVPPDYELKNVKGPIFMYFGVADEYVSRIDVDRLIAKLPNSTLAGFYEVPISNFDHLAFLYTNNVKGKVNDQVTKDIMSIKQ